MNLLLIEASEIDEEGRAVLSGRRAQHLCRVLRVAVGDRVRAGVVGGDRGEASVESIARPPRGVKAGPSVTVRFLKDGDAAESAGTGEEPGALAGSEAPAIDLIVGMPRPAVLHRVLQHAATLGIRRLDLVNAWKVEKSYFQSPAVEEAAIHRHLLLGAEQGCLTRLPEVRVHPLLVPFVESLGAGESAGDALRLIAHPATERAIEQAVEGAGSRRVVLAIGPEGGWIDRELATFAEHGFLPVSLGPWILRSEAAVTAAVAQVALIRRWGTGVSEASSRPVGLLE